jgi:hypothetical protein
MTPRHDDTSRERHRRITSLRSHQETIVDDAKHTYRDVKTEVKETARGLDGTDLKDHLGNAGDEARKDLGNVGDDVRHASQEPKTRESQPTPSADRSS